MLVLPVDTRGALIVLADADSQAHFVAPARPRLSRTAAGKPLLGLDRWILPAGSEGVAAIGGRLNLTVDLAASPQEIAAAGLGPGAVQSIPWLDASLELRGPLFGSVTAEVAVAAGAQAVITTELPPEAAALLASLLTRDTTSPLQIIWTGSVLVRLPAIEITASAAVNQTVSVSTVGFFARRRVARSLVEANARVEIRGVNNPELEAVFRDWALGELAQCMVEGRPLSVHASSAQVVHWPIRLATTLDDLLSTDSRQELVQTHDLDLAELGKPPMVEVRALGAFTSGLERVDVRITPAGGTAVELSLTSEAPQRVALGTGDFDWTYRAKLASQAPGEWSAPRTAEHSCSLLIPIPVSNDLSVEALASGLDFEHRWSAVHIELSHQGAPADSTSTVLELNSAHPSALWKKSLSGPAGRVRARLTFLSKQGLSLELPFCDVTGGQLIVEDPLNSHQRRLALIPTGNGWVGISVAMVDLRYSDGDFRFEETVELKSLDDFVEWVTPARPDGPRTIGWRCHACYKDGRFMQTTWQFTDAEVLGIPLQAPATQQVQLLPVFFDAIKTPRLDVNLRSGGKLITQTVTSSAAVTITMPEGPIFWGITWTLADGSQKETPERAIDQEVIVLPHGPP